MAVIALAGAGTLTTLGVLLAGAALAGFWLQTRRRGLPGVHCHSVSLGGQHALHVVELEGRRLLVGTGPGAAPHLLTELGPGLDATPGPVGSGIDAG